MSVSIIRDNSHALAALLERAAVGAVKASCDAMREECETEVRVRTGSLRSGFYVADGEKSDYAEVAAEAQALNPKIVILPEVRPETPNEAILSNVGQHNYWNELGSIHMAPVPAMHQAADAEKGRLPARVEKAIAEATR